MGKRNVTQINAMTLEELQRISAEIDVLLEKSSLNPAEFVEVLAFTIAKYMYAMGVRRPKVYGAVEALSKDIIKGFGMIETVFNIIEEEAN